MGPTRLVHYALVALAIFALAAAIAGSPTLAQEAGGRLSISRIDNSEFPDLTAYLSVTGATGQPLKGLEATDFFVQEEGELVTELEVESVVDVGTPVLVVIALDVSGSMEGEKLEAAKRAASQLLEGLSSNDEVALLSFSDTVNVVLEPVSADDVAVQEAISSFVASGNTALYDGAYRALQVAGASTFARRAVVLLTDGQDSGNVSLVGRDDVLRLAESSAASIFTVGLGDDAERGLLQELSALTGGEAEFPTSESALGELFDRIGQLLRSQYQLTFRSAVPADSGTYTLAIGVTVGGEQLRADSSFTSKPVEPRIGDPFGGEAPSGTVDIEPTISAQGAVTKVEFLIDGDTVHTSTNPPFSYRLNTEALSRGEHTFSIRATDASGNVGFQDYSFELTGTSFNWGFAFLAAGAAALVVVIILLYFRARRRQVVTIEGPTLPEEGAAIPEPVPVSSEEISVSGTADPELSPARLTVRSGNEKGREVGIRTDPVTIGRAEECNIVLREPKHAVSRVHARIVPEDGLYIIEDLGSTNGTRVNGKQIDRAYLQPGDEIEIGKCRLVFALESEAGVSSPQASPGMDDTTRIERVPDA